MTTSRLLSILIIALLAIPLQSAGAEELHITFADPTEVRGDLGPATSPSDAVARVSEELGITGARFAFTHHRTSLVGQHDRGVQVIDGLPVDGTWVAVHTVDGRVLSVQASASDLTGRAADVAIGAAAAQSAALAALGTSEAIDIATERLLVDVDGALVDTYRVSIVGHGVAGSVDVDAATGVVRGIHDDRRFADAVATLFNPNPIATSGHVDMRQDVDVAGVDVDFTSDGRVAAEQVDLPILGYDLARAAAGNLVGPHVDVIGAGPMVDVLGRFDVSKTDPRFEGLMAYHHIDAIQRYFQDELGLDNINNESQLTVALPVVGFDNSFYQPANDLVLFGAGGVDDGEDAEVIIHELGHAIHDDQVPGWGRRPEGGAMGEGFGDFLAGTYYATFEGTVRSQDTCLMEWDATSYASPDGQTGQTCLRRMDTAKTYADKVGQVHADGEIWSKYLWNLRGHMGATEREKSANVLQLLLNAHFLVSPNAEFRNVIDAMGVVVADPDFAEATGADAETIEAWAAAITGEADALGIPHTA